MADFMDTTGLLGGPTRLRPTPTPPPKNVQVSDSEEEPPESTDAEKETPEESGEGGSPDASKESLNDNEVDADDSDPDAGDDADADGADISTLPKWAQTRMKKAEEDSAASEQKRRDFQSKAQQAENDTQTAINALRAAQPANKKSALRDKLKSLPPDELVDVQTLTQAMDESEVVDQEAANQQHLEQLSNTINAAVKRKEDFNDMSNFYNTQGMQNDSEAQLLHLLLIGGLLTFGFTVIQSLS